MNTLTKSRKLTDTMDKAKAPTFASLYDIQKNVAKEKAQVLKSNRYIFQRLITAYQAGRPVNLDKILSHEIVEVPISLAAENKSLRSGNKAILREALTKDVSCPSKTELSKASSSKLVVDGQTLIGAFGKPADVETFADYADIFVKHILNKGRQFDRIYVTFDHYIDTGTSIKDGTREIFSIY